MTVAELLALLHQSDKAFATLHGCYRVTQNEAVAREAFFASFGSRTVHEASQAAPPTAVETDSHLEVWQAPPEIHMVETTASGTLVASGDFLSIFRPWRLSAVLRLDVSGAGAYANRATTHVVATPRATGDARQDLLDATRDLSGLGPGATRYEMQIDAELGIVVEARASYGEQEFRAIEMVSLEVNQSLPPGIFSQT